MKPINLRQSARGESCALQIYPFCNENTETVVLCHLPSNAGWAMKSPDWWAAYGCDACHSVIDGRMKTELSREQIKDCMLRGLYRTWSRMIESGLIDAQSS